VPEPAQVICSSCGTENEVGRKFCKECAARLAVTCPSCGAANSADAKFCGECASPLGAGTIAARVTTPRGAPGVAPAVPGPTAERRLVSVLFADLVGFTPFAEERDAEDVRDTLSRYFDLASEVIGRYGGTVEKFIGDAVMAVWGAPTAQEDDAELAVRAGLDLVDAVRGLGAGIEARAGVLTGEAAVTLGATNQGMVAGDLVNTAARLQGVAPPGAVLVGGSTHRAASGAIAFEEAGEHLLKGKTAPVPAWRALRVVAQRRGQGRADMPEPPFVGRDEEFRLLRDLLSAAGRDRKTRLVSITGPGGIGKSRLAWELEKYIDGVVETVYWHRGRSPAYGDGITFWALGEMVRRRAGLAETDDEATTRERIAATVAEFVPDADDRRWVEPALLTLLGLEPAPPGGRDALFAAWRIFFERIGARGTTILLFEDLQWADSGLLDFIDHLVEWSRGVPILVVTLARPELFDKRPDWGAGSRNFTAIALEPLSDQAMRALLEGFVPGLPGPAVEAILARADGVPLYAVETVRALVADGRLERIDGSYRPTGDLTDLAIPETLRSLIASRLDALDPVDRNLVQDAAVLGQTFTLAGLSAVTGRDESDLEARLRVLVRRELLELEADPRSPERGQYGFVQALIREVAYGTLARPERRARHLAVARFFETLGEDELAGALATHYVAAYEASAEGPEANAVAIQARLALSGAAERAASLGAHDQAVAYLRQAVEVTGDPSERGALLERAARSASDAADHETARTLARQAVDEHRRAGDATSAARATAIQGAVLLNAQEPAQAVEIPDDVPDEARARLLTNLSRAYMRNDVPERAVEIADQALPLAERNDLDEVIADAFNNKGSGLSYLGRSREATALMEAAIALAHASGNLSTELRARSNLASILWSVDPRRSITLQDENYELARRVGNRQMANWIVQSVVAGAWLTAGDWDAVQAEAGEALASARDLSEEANILSSMALIWWSRGDSTDHALERLELAAAQVSDPIAPAQLHFLKGCRALDRGACGDASSEMVAAAELGGLASIYLSEAIRPALWGRDLDAARRIAERLDRTPDARETAPSAERAAAWAGVAALEGRREEALAGYRDAVRRLRAIGYDFEVARVQLDAALLLGVEAPELRAGADEARAVFERVRARPYLERLDAAIAHPASSSERVTRRAGSPTAAPS
jgi:class 3 adenylate cyclase/tetratricopeptide (TPR) repeat protein